MTSSEFISTTTGQRRLEGKVALITGGASGIGRCTVKLFVHHGAKVVLADIQDDVGHALCTTVLGPNNSLYVHCDVTNEPQVQAAVEAAVKTFGKLDIMMNNAGIADPSKPRIIDNDKHDFDQVLNINVTGVFLGIKHAAQTMIPAKTGSIISTASVASYVGGAASHAYTCSKHAVVGLTKNAAVELGQFGIRVNCLSPFGLVTPSSTKYMGLDEAEFEMFMSSKANLKGVTLKAEDVANAALFLASDESRYVSGHNLFIDGGFSIVNPNFKIFQYPQD